MKYFEQFAKHLPQLLTSLSIILTVLVVIWLANWILLRRTREMGEERRFPRRIAMMIIAVVGIVIILLAFPVTGETKDQMVALVGLVTTAAIALASTTFVANAMAGLMLRTVHSFRPGDFVRVEDHFGRVTERGLFHTEIQTEDRDLVTLPNLFLVTHPVKVVRASGTVVSARVSLGYLSEIERGQKEASSELLAAICGALEVSLSDVLASVSTHVAEAESEEIAATAADGAPAPGDSDETEATDASDEAEAKPDA